jgi:hypothetical protein
LSRVGVSVSLIVCLQRSLLAVKIRDVSLHAPLLLFEERSAGTQTPRF